MTLDDFGWCRIMLDVKWCWLEFKLAWNFHITLYSIWQNPVQTIFSTCWLNDVGRCWHFLNVAFKALRHATIFIVTCYVILISADVIANVVTKICLSVWYSALLWLLPHKKSSLRGKLQTNCYEKCCERTILLVCFDYCLDNIDLIQVALQVPRKNCNV